MARGVQREYHSSSGEVQCGDSHRLVLSADVPLGDVSLGCSKAIEFPLIIMKEIILADDPRGMGL